MIEESEIQCQLCEVEHEWHDLRALFFSIRLINYKIRLLDYDL